MTTTSNNTSQALREIDMFGMYVSQIKDDIKMQLSTPTMFAMSCISNAQELMTFGPGYADDARQQLNIAKYVIREFCDDKEGR